MKKVISVLVCVVDGWRVGAGRELVGELYYIHEREFLSFIPDGNYRIINNGFIFFVLTKFFKCDRDRDD